MPPKRKENPNQFEETQLEKSITTFSLASKCQSPSFCQGDCDNISQAFLDHTAKVGLEGIILAVDKPIQEPTLGWKNWGSQEEISHYMCFFPSLQKGVDWSARQFWDQADCPQIQTVIQIKEAWEDLPFQLEDARNHEEEVAGSKLT